MSGELGAGQDEPAVGHEHERPTKSYLIASGVLLALAAFLTVAAVFAMSRGGESAGLPPEVAGAAATPTTAAAAPTGTPASLTGSPTSAAATTAATSSPTATSSAPTAAPTGLPIVGPTSSPTATPSSLSVAGEALAQSIEAEFGMRIVRLGQDWGSTEDLQVRNLTAVRAAISGVPAAVRATVNQTSPLAFLSNRSGATEGGWQPYGAREANYYTNEDLAPAGTSPSNQVVLQPGSTSQTIAHEIMHAYQMRDVSAGQYALALLSPEMKSFMQATGWTQLGSDDDVRAAIGGGWDAVNALFQYNGRILTYSNEFGDSLTLYTPNPVEAFAEAAGLYYGHNPALILPDWAEYWDWFQTNVG